MALETLLFKVKTAISNSFDSVPPKLLKKKITSSTSFKNSKRNVAVLAFEIAGVMSKLLHLYHSLSDATIVRIRNDAVTLEGVRKIISNDESFLLGLACAEFTEALRVVANSVTRLSQRCEDHNLRDFHRAFLEFADSGRDTNGWVLSGPKEIEAKFRKMERYVMLTAALHREMEELSVLESGFRKALNLNHHHHHRRNSSSEVNEGSLGVGKEQKIYELQQKICWQKQEVKDLKDRCLWSRSFDGVVLLLVRFCFTVLARIKVVFGIGHSVPCLSPSLSTSATVYPSDQNSNSCHEFVSGSLEISELEEIKERFGSGFFESNSKLLKPPPSTLGASALALHYANLIIVLEKMIKTPHLIGLDARDDLYGMLPSSIRSGLRTRLKGIGFCASDPVLAGEWKDALGRILGWLSPLAHNMIKWQSERSFEQHNLVPKTNVLLLQTLFFANKQKTEAAITELLVGLNYIWRFEREMTAKALFECANFNGFIKSAKT
ncbi:protein PSK SIMULATOR 3-like [Vicia villosa]|uniref:protein PSK SIMULATOR 3-like n=1 Tax=Vicia villosa TaxID=3911 RepID=UPI00273C8515|nr:protein PSK SIMULATOR 3-like [Vicia villosa]